MISSKELREGFVELLTNSTKDCKLGEIFESDLGWLEFTGEFSSRVKNSYGWSSYYHYALCGEPQLYGESEEVYDERVTGSFDTLVEELEPERDVFINVIDESPEYIVIRKTHKDKQYVYYAKLINRTIEIFDYNNDLIQSIQFDNQRIAVESFQDFNIQYNVDTSNSWHYVKSEEEN